MSFDRLFDKRALLWRLHTVVVFASLGLFGCSRTGYDLYQAKSNSDATVDRNLDSGRDGRPATSRLSTQAAAVEPTAPT
jgi:hypothetical protein